MKQIPYHYLKSIMITLCLVGIFSMSLPSDARAACTVYTGGHEQPGPKYPDHPVRLGYYFYLGHAKEDIFEGKSSCGFNSNYSEDSKLEKLQNQIDNAYVKFAGCEKNDAIGNCHRNYGSPRDSRSYFSEPTVESCGAGFQKDLKYGRFYYCAGGGMLERTDFIPVHGCAPNTYAATDNCQPCPEGKYSPKGSTNISQCVDAKANEAVWAIRNADAFGFPSCPKGANMNGTGNCSCKKGTKWKSKKEKCE